ncbi:MAG: fibronectin type III domain-containing protein [Acidobacteriota bacterium]
MPFAFCLFFSACGKPGNPIPPARLTERATDLAAIQRGAKILLTWSLPPLNKKETDANHIARVDVYRLTERPDEAPVLDAVEYETDAEIIGVLDRATIEAQAQTVGNLQFTDSINPNQARANLRLRYAVRYVNKRGQQAAFSNTVALELVAVVAAPPGNLQATNKGQGEVLIEWAPSATNVDGSTPSAVAGYNLYRVKANRKLDRGKPLNDEPLTDSRFIDRTFQYKTEYAYVVRALSQGRNGLIESADSEVVNFTPIDSFAPSTPEPVSIASANGTISLFWPSSTESDVVGYFIYRAESEAADEMSWVKLNAQPVKETTFQDMRVTIDKKYFYRVSAVDTFQNQSPPSIIVSETAHP